MKKRVRISLRRAAPQLTEIPRAGKERIRIPDDLGRLDLADKGDTFFKRRPGFAGRAGNHVQADLEAQLPG